LHFKLLNHAHGSGCHLHTPSHSLFPLLAQTSFVITLCLCPCTTDSTARSVVPPLAWWDEVVERVPVVYVVLWFFVFVFPEFCVSRCFRAVEFVAATFMRHGRKQLLY
jgi:hypothetical protein